LGLVIVTLVAAQVIAIAVVFNLPPPPPEFYRSRDRPRLKTGETVQTRDGRALVIKKRPSGDQGPGRLGAWRVQGRHRSRDRRRSGADRDGPIDDGPRFFVRRLKKRGPKAGRDATTTPGSREGQAVLVVPEALAVPEISSSARELPPPAIAAHARPRPTSPSSSATSTGRAAGLTVIGPWSSPSRPSVSTAGSNGSC
jgi:hypothetical protein